MRTSTGPASGGAVRLAAFACVQRSKNALGESDGRCAGPGAAVRRRCNGVRFGREGAPRADCRLVQQRRAERGNDVAAHLRERLTLRAALRIVRRRRARTSRGEAGRRGRDGRRGVTACRFLPELVDRRQQELQHRGEDEKRSAGPARRPSRPGARSARVARCEPCEVHRVDATRLAFAVNVRAPGAALFYAGRR